MIGAIAAARRRLHSLPGRPPPLAWRLLGLPVCGSTEHELERRLGGFPKPPLAVLARRQRHGQGQRGRPWLSEPGGVWISAALPWPEEPGGAADLGLAVAVGVALQLEELGLAVQIKWPNDLLVGGCKLAGLLPRLRIRNGRIRWARVGLGLNGSNRVPAGAISVAGLLGRPLGSAGRAALAARVLIGLEWAASRAHEPEAVRLEANRRLLLPARSVPFEGELWQPLELNGDGSLALVLGDRRAALIRRF